MKESGNVHTDANTRIRMAAWWRRYWVAALVVGVAALAGLAGLCAAIHFIVIPATTVTPGLEPVAQQARANPASAKLHVNIRQDWGSYNPGDYAVEDGMVIFPKPNNGPSLFPFNDVTLDKTIPVLVYAPDGRDLTTRPGRPSGRSWLYIGEWFLVDCHTVTDDGLWWDCMLLIGGNI